MNSHKPLNRLNNPACVAELVVSEQNVPIRQSMKKRFFYSVLLITGFLLTTGTGLSGAQVINCSSGFNTTTTGNSGCGVSPYNQYAEFMIENQPTTILRGTAAVLEPSGAPHNSYSLIKQVPVNDQAFTATYTFVPNGLNLAFVVENNHNSYSSSPSYPFSAYVFQAGAGAEGGFSQSAGGGNYPPDHVFALELDSAQGMNNSYGAFSHSNIQLFQTLQSPIRPMCCTGYLPEYETDTLSTSPVSLNSPVSAAGTTTGDTYSATVTYNHGTGTLVYSLFDVTTGGSCPGASCFTHTWTNVWIPEIVGSTTAYVGLTAGSSGYNGGSATDLLIRSLTYTVNTPSGTPAYTAWNANSTYNIGTPSAASPVYSVAPGTYGAAQTVAISTSTGPHNYICYVLSPSTPTLYPQPDNNGGCAAGTLYTGPITISNTATLYAMAGSNNSAFPIAAQEPPGLGPPSTLVAGTYTIGAGSSIAATPSFSPPGGTFTATQSVALADASPYAAIYYTTDGTTPTVSSARYIQPLTLDSSTELKAIAVVAGAADSSVASADYSIITPGTPSTPSTLTFSPAAGTYASSQSVIIDGVSSNAKIYYTLNGSTPTTSSSPYNGPVAVSSTETLKAIAVTSNDVSSAVASASYRISVAAIPAVINFANGFTNSSSTVRAIGGAYYSGSTIQLTSFMGGSASVVYFSTPVNVQGFSTTFTWTAQCPSAGSGVGCGNGIGFAIASTNYAIMSNYRTAGVGGVFSWAFACLSTGICEPTDSVLVKFDLLNNQTGGASANLTGYYTAGASSQAQQTQYDMAPAGIHVQSGHLMRATLTYDGRTLYETVIDTITGATYSNHYTTNIPALVGGNTALVGFAGGTGTAQVQQNLHSWTYTARQ